MDRIPTQPFSAMHPPDMPNRIATRSSSQASSNLEGSTVAKAIFWDRIARKYSANPISDLAGYEFTVRRVESLLAAHHEVLEVGCGTGTTALRLAAGTRRFRATDVSSAMIAIAKEKLATHPIEGLSFEVADADESVFGEATYDIVLAFNLLHLVSNLDDAIAAALHSLKPGGLFISKTPCLSEMNPLISRLALPLMRAIGKAPHVLCFNSDRLQSCLTRQGLELLSTERHGTRGKDIRVFIVARKPY